MLFPRCPPGWFFLLRTWRLTRLGVVGIVMALCACATVPREHTADAYAGKSLEDQVKERATQRWGALMRGDLDSAYGYFSRATRDTFPFELYRAKMRPGIWREAKVESVKCADGLCEVVVVLTIDHKGLKGAIAPVTERWIVQDGLAWYVYNG
jgi:hypothetical protein